MDSVDLQELLDSRNQNLTIDEIVKRHEQEQDVEELEYLDPVQTEDRMTVGSFDAKDSPRTGRTVVENLNKITEIIEVDRHVSSRSITQELKIDNKIFLSHLRKVGF
ncbi:hypothetical protein TNCV_1883281 [Trichonephila clavipes]|nr:hypothetical protein TNCV_1883281 [Trichonephila clavipes]